MIGNIGAVFWFEWKRALSWSRMLWSLALALFPVFIMGIVLNHIQSEFSSLDTHFLSDLKD